LAATFDFTTFFALFYFKDIDAACLDSLGIDITSFCIKMSTTQLKGEINLAQLSTV